VTDWADRYTLEISSADPDAQTPVWVDFTDRVRNDDDQPMETASGRQNDLDEAEPAPFVMVLGNDDNEVTYGNPDSTYAAWWGPGRKCRLRETFAEVTADRYTGYLQTPTELVVTDVETGLAQRRVHISAIDRLGRLASAPQFVSTLAAFIQNANTAAPLAYYWPLGGSAAPFAPVVGSLSFPLLAQALPAAVRSAETHPAVLPGDGGHLPGDDLSAPYLRLGANGALSADYPVLTAGEQNFLGGVVGPDPPGSLNVDGIGTVVMWVNPQMPYNETVTLLTVDIAMFPFDLATWTIKRLATTGLIELAVDGSITGTLTSTIVLPTDRWTMLAAYVISLGGGSARMVLWVDGVEFTSGAAGSGLDQSVMGITIGGKYQGSVAHVQIYGDDPDDTDLTLTAAELAAQRRVALLDYDQQTTNDQMLTIARFAGIPETELLRVDPGVAAMSPLLLAGKTALQPMREAETTEQGLLYVDGSGNLVFKDRRTLYNI